MVAMLIGAIPWGIGFCFTRQEVATAILCIGGLLNSVGIMCKTWVFIPAAFKLAYVFMGGWMIGTLALLLAGTYPILKYGLGSAEEKEWDLNLMMVFGIKIIRGDKDSISNWLYSLVGGSAIGVLACLLHKWFTASHLTIRCHVVNGKVHFSEKYCQVNDQTFDPFEAIPKLVGNSIAIYGLIRYVAIYMIKHESGAAAKLTAMDGFVVEGTQQTTRDPRAGSPACSSSRADPLLHS